MCLVVQSHGCSHVPGVLVPIGHFVQYLCSVTGIYSDVFFFWCVLSLIFFNTAPRSPKVGKNVDKSLAAGAAVDPQRARLAIQLLELPFPRAASTMDS